ncbi:Putative arginyl-tRNA--protein transferase [Chlamydiales bacterium SCGC AG-110-P3]|nr:Putative arginyl-tRNA--protein transferase [Chlamydiales bacterium SCGC AG-110-P3]
MRYRPFPTDHFPCPYIPGLTACYEAFWVDEITPGERQHLLEYGYRSFGKYWFRPQCEGCNRCIPIRIPVSTFHPTKSQRRSARKNTGLVIKVGEPHYTDEKFEIYCDHLQRFSYPEDRHEAESFRISFYDPDVPALEFCYYIADALIAFGSVQKVPNALSSVYFCYRLEYSKLSLGKFSVLKEIEVARQLGKEYLYLGYYIEQNHFMSYKAMFGPNEILDSGRWIPFR